MTPLRYDFPRRMRGLASAEREITRLGRSIAAARERREKHTLDYLERRLRRAERAYRRLQLHEGITTP
ncbi:hypothetical protein MED01_007050 [Micromonospora sp. MED01]|uniref:hypothetical protein n=1 Tax=Micromonospora alfalfae TaxID=2911212 RepID=UPI001EE78375|nr:hypothetical protein [Micromonospora alfalfae]MCG5462172.1 hypothetical protein [Micromonospora alfalfae]